MGIIKLIFRGKLLADDKTLESYDIKDGGIVMILAVKKTAEQVQDEADYDAHKAVTRAD